MLNFTNQKAGTIAGLGVDNGLRVTQPSDVVVVNKEVEGKGVHYWATLAKGLQESMAGLVDKKEELERIAIERRANDAGLRAVIRYLLAELRKTQPNHPLLDKKNRDRIFEEFHKQEMDKILKMNNMEKVWEPLERPDEKQSP